MRKFQRKSGQGFTLIELMLAVLAVVGAVVGLAILIGAVILVVIFANRALDASDHSDQQPQSVIIELADDTELAATDSGAGMNCVCLLRNRSQCIERALVDSSCVASVDLFDIGS